MSSVNGLKWRPEMGTWRGHEIHYDTDKNLFVSESAGVSEPTLQAVKREIDKIEKVKYVPVNVLVKSGYGSAGSPATLVKPAEKASVWRDRPSHVGTHAWVRDKDGKLTKEKLSRYTLDTPVHRRIFEEQTAIIERARKAIEGANRVIEALPDPPMPEREEE